MKDGNVEKQGGVDNKLTAWLSVAEIADTCRKPGNDSLIWRLKAVSLCQQTRQLLFHNIPGDENDFGYENNVSSLKSPSTDILVSSSPKNDVFFRSGSFSRGRSDSQSSTSFKHFFSRKLSKTKLMPQISDASSPRSPCRSWRSQDSDNSLEDEFCDGCISLVDPDLCIVRPIHHTVLTRPYCIQIMTPNEMKYLSCNTEEEYVLWLNSLVSTVSNNRDQKIRLDTSLSVWIVEAKGVPLRKRYFCEVLLDKVLFARTSVKCKNDMLFWGEQFNFDDLPPTESLTICLYRESDAKKKRKQEKHTFVGSTVIDLLSMETNTENEKWVSVFVPGVSPKLQQKSTVNGSISGSNGKTDQPYIRAKFKYETTVVLPLPTYKTLHDYVKGNYLLLARTLEASISLRVKDNLAQTLLKIFQANDSAEQFLVDVIMNEVANTPDENLTFRGNSLATKSIDTYMKMIGKNYLQETLGSFITSVYESEEDAEVDPQKITSSSSTLGDNQKYLIKLVEEVWRSIFLSVNAFPRRLRKIFSMVREQCESQGRNISSKIVSASLFLRFLCPAILSPSLFQLMQEYPGEKVARTLTLVAKTIQNLANFTRFGSKESYMEILNDFVESEIPNMDNFLQAISFKEGKSHKPLENSSSGAPKVDVARELSVLYHILNAELPNIPANDAKKLESLKPILVNITKVHSKSPKADELRLSRPFATVASVCSKPLTTPSSAGRDDTPLSLTPGGMTPLSSTIIEGVEFMTPKTPECYVDATLSYTEDYVSGCSLVQHRNSPSRNLAKRNEGRGTMDRKRLQTLSSTPDHSLKHRTKDSKDASKRSKSVDSNVHSSRVIEGKGKFDKLLSVSSQAALSKSQKQMKSDPTLNSLKKKPPVEQQQQQQQPSSPQKVPLRKGKESSVKDRISLFSQKDSSSKTSKVTSKPKTPVVTPTKSSVSSKTFLGSKSLLSSKKTTPKVSEAQSNSMPRSLARKEAAPPTVTSKSLSSTRPTNAPRPIAVSSTPSLSNILNGHPSPSPVHHQLNSPSPKPGVQKKPLPNGKNSTPNGKNSTPNAKNSTPNGKNSTMEQSKSLSRQVKADSKNSPSPIGKNPLRPTKSSPIKMDDKNSSPANRSKLKLSNLKKEHKFEDPTSPELMSYEKSPTRNPSEREIFSDIESQISTVDQSNMTQSNTLPSIASRYDEDEVSWSSKLNLPTRDPSDVRPIPEAYLHRHEHNSKNNGVFCSTTMLPDMPSGIPSDRDDLFRAERRHSETTPHEMEKKKATRTTMVVAQSEDVTQIHSNGFCEVLHEGVVEQTHSMMSSDESSCEYSSESYYTSEEELDYGVFIEGDRMSDVLMKHDRQQKINGCDKTNTKSLNNNNNNNNIVTNNNKMSKRSQDQNLQMKYEQSTDVVYLQENLKETQQQLRKTQAELKTKTSNFEETVIHLKEKLVEADSKMKKQRSETDTQMKNVISRLLNVESELRKEHDEMAAVITGKQKLVDIQERRIKTLEASNTRLVSALTHLRNKYAPNDEGVEKHLKQHGIKLNGELEVIDISPPTTLGSEHRKAQQV